MQESTFISRRLISRHGHFLFAALLFIFWVTFTGSFAHAAEGSGSISDPTKSPEEEDYKQTPYTDYGDFKAREEEEATEKFFQYGRFFGVSIGLGVEGVTGNRGAVYQGGFPLIDLKVHYWFDFHFALDMDFYNVSHYYSVGGVNTNEHILFLGVHVKYYFDTKNLSAGLTFASPYLELGMGSYAKTESIPSQTTTTNADNAFGVSAGGGLEFVASPNSFYVQLEALVHFVSFSDTYSSPVSTVPDLSGLFYTGTVNLMFTW